MRFRPGALIVALFSVALGLATETHAQDAIGPDPEPTAEQIAEETPSEKAVDAARREAAEAEAEADPKAHAARVCDLIAREADRAGLPRPFFARLIWTESRFDPGAVSPVGAEGIAQFMPGTAKLRGLADSFDMETALAASAEYLAEMTRTYGSLGRAAIGYNAGEGRLQRWIGGNPFLPLETENYVQKVMLEPADGFLQDDYKGTVVPLEKDRSFEESCLRLPVIRTPVPEGLVAAAPKPWAIQVAGNFRRDIALRQWQRLRGQYKVLAQHEAVVSRARMAGARQPIYAVRIGAESQSEAETLCTTLRRAGGSCLVRKNR